MTEGDYFKHLEMRVCRELAGMREKSLWRLWCDGFIPEDFEVIGQRCRMSGRVWMGLGNRDQACWTFVLHLGAATPRESIDWASKLPGENATGWLRLDIETQFMKICPEDARPDGDPM